MIVVSKLNDVHIKIDCEEDIAKELSEYFIFDAPNARFSPTKRSRFWDGKIRLFNLKTRLLYCGLRHRLEKFAKDRNYELVYDQSGADLEEAVSELDLSDFLLSLDLHTSGMPIDVRAHQEIPILESLRRRRKLIISPTASGKSLSIYVIARWYIQKGLKGLLIVPTTNLVDQMYSDFEDYSSKNGWPVNVFCSRLYSGLSRTLTSEKLLITTWQSIVNQPKEFFDQFDFVIGDEAQGFQATSLTKIMESLDHCEYRFGFSGSLSGSLVHELVIVGHFGELMKAATTAELVEKGYLATPIIRCMVMRYNSDTCKTANKFNYQEEIEFIISHEKRNKYIARLACSLKGNTLILFRRIGAHGKVLLPLIEQYAKGPVYYIDGGTDVEDRNKVRDIMEKNNGVIALASSGTFAVGVNIRNLHNGIVAHPTKSRILTLQSLGRGLRIGDNKDEINWYDFSDDLRSGSYRNITLDHFLERAKMYNEESLPFKVYRIELEA